MSGDLSEIVQSLRHIKLFSELDEDALNRIAERAEQRSFAEGEDIVKQGAAGSSMYVIVSGSTQVLVELSGGELATQPGMQAGDFFGEVSLLFGGVRSATVIAGDACELIEIGHEALKQALQKRPQLVQALVQTADERRLNDWIANLSVQALDERLANDVVADEVAEYFEVDAS